MPVMTVSIEPMYLSREQTAKFVSLSEDVIYKLANLGEFPRSRRLSNRRVGWLVSELREWCLSRPVSEILPPENTGHANRGRKPLPDNLLA